MKTYFILLLLISGVSATALAQEKMSLNTYLQKVKAQNLDLRVEELKSEAAEANSVGLAIPSPMAGINQMKDASGSVNGFEVNQTLPFPTKLASDHSARKYDSQSQDQKRIARSSELVAQAKVAYFALWGAQEKLSLLKEKKGVIENHIRLARSTARSDSFAGIHVLKAETDLDFLENEMEAISQEVREKQAQLATLINSNATDFKIQTEEPPLSNIPQSVSVDSSPQIQALTFDLESLRSRESEAKSSWLPDFNLRYKEMGGTSLTPRYSETMVGVTLPFVFFWEPNAETKKASAQRMQAEAVLENQRRNIESEKVTLLSRAESLKKQILNLKEKIIPKAEKRMKLVHNLAPRDMETLQDHRETMEAFPDLKLKALALRLDYEQTVSGLEKYLAKKEQNQ